MKKTAFNIKNIAIVSFVLVIAISTWTCIAAAANTNGTENSGFSKEPNISTLSEATNKNTTENNASSKEQVVSMLTDTPSQSVVEQYANRFEGYKDYGISYDKEKNNLYFNDELVRYFEDYYPVSEDDNAYAGIDYFNENGTIDVHGIRDLTQIVRNINGSYDPSGKLLGVKAYSKDEFDMRDISKLKNTQQIVASNDELYSSINADNAASQTPIASNDGLSSTNYADNADSQPPLKNNDGMYSSIANITDSGIQTQDRTIAEIFEDYKDYGIKFNENSVNGGLGNVYYKDKLVKTFTDIKPDGGVFMFSSSDSGEITVSTVYDKNGKLTGIKTN